MKFKDEIGIIKTFESIPNIQKDNIPSGSLFNRSKIKVIVHFFF
jgi:hypothetical protein